MATITKFEDLECWKEASKLCQLVFVFISRSPFSQDFPLKNQINESSGSAMDNIAEGFERGGTREFIQFLSVAKGSAAETRSQLVRAWDRAYITPAEFAMAVDTSETVIKKIQALINYLNNSGFKGTKFIVKEPLPAFNDVQFTTSGNGQDGD